MERRCLGRSPAEAAAQIGSRNDHAEEAEHSANVVWLPRQGLDLSQALGFSHCHDTVLVVADGKANAATARARRHRRQRCVLPLLESLKISNNEN
jgi:hypothetical protein